MTIKLVIYATQRVLPLIQKFSTKIGGSGPIRSTLFSHQLLSLGSGYSDKILLCGIKPCDFYNIWQIVNDHTKCQAHQNVNQANWALGSKCHLKHLHSAPNEILRQKCRINTPSDYAHTHKIVCKASTYINLILTQIFVLELAKKNYVTSVTKTLNSGPLASFKQK